MALTTTTARGVLCTSFPGRTVRGVMDAMIAVGMVKRSASEPFTPHNACIALLSAALPEPDATRALAAAMRMRDWKATGPAPGRRLAPGMANSGLSDVRLIRTMISEILCKQPTGWWISPVEVIGHGLRFSQGDYDGAVPARIRSAGGEWVTVPSWVMAEFGRHHGSPTESQRAMNALLLGRIQKSLRPEKIEEAAE